MMVIDVTARAGAGARRTSVGGIRAANHASKCAVSTASTTHRTLPGKRAWTSRAGNGREKAANDNGA
jgi:hypothetical protein